MSGPVRRRGAVATRLVSVAATLLGAGCARLVTLNPELVSRRNYETWSVRSTPPAPATGSPESPTVVQPLPFAQRPEAVQALRSPPDALGIPEDLYAIDPLLSAHRREMESQASARRQVGAGVIVVGLVGGAIAAWAISAGADASPSPGPGPVYAAQGIIYGSLLAVMSAGEIISGIALAASSSDPAPLQRYYRETYGASR